MDTKKRTSKVLYGLSLVTGQYDAFMKKDEIIIKCKNSIANVYSPTQNPELKKLLLQLCHNLPEYFVLRLPKFSSSLLAIDTCYTVWK